MFGMKKAKAETEGKKTEEVGTEAKEENKEETEMKNEKKMNLKKIFGGIGAAAAGIAAVGFVALKVLSKGDLEEDFDSASSAEEDFNQETDFTEEAE